MKFKSAPAPWRYDGRRTTRRANWATAGGGVINDAGGHAAIYLAGRLNGTADYVGRLIAAAPDLYAALRDLADNAGPSIGLTPAMQRARAALAKAVP